MINTPAEIMNFYADHYWRRDRGANKINSENKYEPVILQKSVKEFRFFQRLRKRDTNCPAETVMVLYPWLTFA